jgi:hypothetical protein
MRGNKMHSKKSAHLNACDMELVHVELFQNWIHSILSLQPQVPSLRGLIKLFNRN